MTGAHHRQRVVSAATQPKPEKACSVEFQKQPVALGLMRAHWEPANTRSASPGVGPPGGQATAGTWSGSDGLGHTKPGEAREQSRM